ncbi:MAG: leucine-rich repeat domain-containing protein [Bacteroidota bacterium]
MIAYSLREARKAGIALEALFLDRQGLKSIPEEIRDYKNLKTLDLSHNGISDLPKWLSTLKNLEKLSLNFNQIIHLGEELVRLKKLRELNLSHNQLTTVDFENLPPSLSELDVSQNGLSKIKIKVKQSSLIRIDCTDNHLRRFPSLIFFPALKVMKLGKNKINTFPKVESNNEIQQLDFHKNPLKTVGPQIGQLHKLNHLNLQQTKIKNLPSELANCTYIRTLLLDNNEIHHIPPQLHQLHWLAELSLANNRLSSFPEIVKELPRLAILNLSKNQISEFTDLRNQAALRALNISDNPLAYILHLPPNLQVLTMRKTAINSFVFLLQIPQLRAFDMGKQLWARLPVNLFGLRQLAVLKGGVAYPQKKQLLRFLQALKQVDLSNHEARSLFHFWQNGTECNQQILVKGLSLSIRPLQEKIKAQILAKEAIPVDITAFNIHGKTPKKWAQKLEQVGISISLESQKIILGKAPYPFPERDYSKAEFYNIAQLEAFLQQKSDSSKPSINAKQQTQLIKLLLHTNPLQIKKAILLFPKGPCAPELQIALVLAWKLQEVGPLKQELRKKISEKVTPPLDQFSNLSITAKDRTTPQDLEEKLIVWLDQIQIEHAFWDDYQKFLT